MLSETRYALNGDLHVAYRTIGEGPRNIVFVSNWLATVLFTDIVDSTSRAVAMGDRDWRALLDAHDAVVRSQLSRYRGRELSTAGDSFLAKFDGPQRAIRCALSIRDAVRALGIDVRAGLHTGECEVRGDDVGGIAVHIGPACRRSPGPARYSYRARCATWSSAQGSRSTTAARTT